MAGLTGRRPVVGWVLFDFANSPFTTLVVTFVYATYFTQVIAPDPVTGTLLWSRAITITALIVAVLSPLLGAIADRGRSRRGFLIATTVISSAATAALYWVLPGQVLIALVLFVMANVAFEFGTVFYNAYLPDVSTSETIGRVSGWGWGLGYVGGLFALALALVGFVRADPPWFGFAAGDESIRATNLLVAVWFLVFSVPCFLFVRERRTQQQPVGVVLRSAIRQLIDSFRHVRRHAKTWRFLVARLIYNDGLVTIFAFGGIYAAGTFGFTTQEVLIFGIVINLAAGLGSVAMGYLDDRLGAKTLIVLSLVGLIGAAVLAVLATDRTLFWVAGVLLGVFVGPNQSSSRSLLARLAPEDMRSEFFGFFALSGKLTAFVGPFLLGEVTARTESQRAGILVVVGLLAIGLLLMLRVDSDRSDTRV